MIENTQRDLNIALVNEFSLIFARMGLDTLEVLEAAGTKWNFLPFTPGLVGGHCIGVDPYYLTYRAEQLGYRPEVILAGRRINDHMGRLVAQELIKGLLAKGTNAAGARVLVMGLAFKEKLCRYTQFACGGYCGRAQKLLRIGRHLGPLGGSRSGGCGIWLCAGRSA